MVPTPIDRPHVRVFKCVIQCDAQLLLVIQSARNRKKRHLHGFEEHSTLASPGVQDCRLLLDGSGVISRMASSSGQVFSDKYTGA